MDHTLSSYPSGVPGSGLLLLRLVLAGYLLAAASGPLLSSGASRQQEILLDSCAVAAVVCGALVLAGWLTRVVQIAVAIAGLIAVVVHFSMPEYDVLLFGSGTAVLATGIATGLALLGPGAYSLDAVLFGRWEIVIPPH